jgi:hypothetical protein
VLTVRSSGLDDSQVTALARNLRAELLKLDVDNVVAAPTGELPEGAKGTEVVAVGALVVSLAPVVVAAVLEVVGSWLRRQSTEIEIEIDGDRFKGNVTREQREALLRPRVVWGC